MRKLRSRTCEVARLPRTKNREWLYERLMATNEAINAEYWRFALNSIEEVQVLRYKPMSASIGISIRGTGWPANSPAWSICRLPDPLGEVDLRLEASITAKTKRGCKAPPPYFQLTCGTGRARPGRDSDGPPSHG
jgi:hypothetical protein